MMVNVELNRQWQMNLKSQLKMYLDHRGWTPTELARKTGVSKQNISLWLSGTPPRNIEQVKLIAEALGTSVDHLCFGEGIDGEREQATALGAILGEQWVTGCLEFKVRLMKKKP